MMSRSVATVASVDDANVDSFGVQVVRTEQGDAINYTELSGILNPGDTVLLNKTARDLSLGTGGFDFVIARLAPGTPATMPANRVDGHIMSLRYTPMQHTAPVVEEDEEFARISAQSLGGFPVVACELHSQIAPVAAAIEAGHRSAAYVMTDSAALGLGFSNLIALLTGADLLKIVYTVGQSFGGAGTNQAVTLHSALIAAKHGIGHDAAIVSQGPGNTGTATKYGFSGISQSSNLDIAAALGATPILCVRASQADRRDRHRGVSHHTRTVLELVRSRVIVAMPEGLDAPDEWSDRHDVRIVARDETQAALDLLAKSGIAVTTMGRAVEDDPLFFHAAAAAGIIAARLSSI
jgi:hypothetical protein